MILTLFANSLPPCNPDSDSLLLILENGPEATPGPDGYICQGMSFTAHGFGVSNSSDFTWQHDGRGELIKINTLNPEYTPAPDELGSVRLTLKVSGITACRDSSISCHNQVSIYSVPGIKTGKEQSIKYDSPAMLTSESSGGTEKYTFEWKPASLLMNNSVQNPQTVNLFNDTVFIVTIMDQVTGCTATDSCRVKVGPKKENEDCIVIHNVITPNGDSINDKWVIDCIELYPENNVELFNRWGDLVNSFRNYNNTSVVWEGTNSKGEILPDGTYFYSLKTEHDKTLTGWVFLRAGKN